MEWLLENPLRLLLLPVEIISIFFPNKVRDVLYEIHLLRGGKNKFSVNDGFGPYDKQSQLRYIRIVGLIMLILLVLM